ncbi:putative CUB domain-containing protein-like 1 [Homarus americanus]|uniref:Putative CUB domain-containing protein-like 1 n=1 Tax=Homarus americanus TaxID=6706 RepID=A0A8J5JZA4_HOMAM|nr:putative CUB domain-containing protein-like 1 [Homarus americanus]
MTMVLSSRRCEYDWVTVGEGGGSTPPERMCGDWSARLKLLRYVSHSNRVVITFVTDYAHHFPGFRARVSARTDWYNWHLSLPPLLPPLPSTSPFHLSLLLLSPVSPSRLPPSHIRAQDVCVTPLVKLLVAGPSCRLTQVIIYANVVWSSSRKCYGVGAEWEEWGYEDYGTGTLYWVGGTLHPDSHTWSWRDGSPLNVSGMAYTHATPTPLLSYTHVHSMPTPTSYTHNLRTPTSTTPASTLVFGGDKWSLGAGVKWCVLHTEVGGVEGRYLAGDGVSLCLSLQESTCRHRGPASTVTHRSHSPPTSVTSSAATSAPGGYPVSPQP